MILNCPSCDARFRVRQEMFANGPRKVRCARCGHKWTGEPESLAEPEPAAVMPPVEEEPLQEVSPVPELRAQRDEPPLRPVETDSAAGSAEFSDVPPLSDAAMAMDRPGARRRTPVWVWVGWLLLVVLVAGTVLALVFARGPLVSLWPPLEGLYSKAEILVPQVVEPAVTIRVTESSLSEKDGKNRMVLKLLIENHTNGTAALPLASVELIDKAGDVFRTQLVRIPGDALSAGEKRPDSLTLDGVPSRLDRVRVVEAQDPGKDK